MFDAPAELRAIRTLLQTFPEIQRVYIGRPLSPENRLCAAVTLGRHTPERWAGEQLVRDGVCLVTLFYRLGVGGVEEAEFGIAALVDAFPKAIEADPTLGGVTLNAVPDTSLADEPRYLLWSAQEFREYPLLVAMRQRDIAPIDVTTLGV